MIVPAAMALTMHIVRLPSPILAGAIVIAIYFLLSVTVSIKGVSCPLKGKQEPGGLKSVGSN
jgi:hypothetical protein